MGVEGKSCGFQQKPRHKNLKAQLRRMNVYHLFSWTHQQLNVYSTCRLPAIRQADRRQSHARSSRSQHLFGTQGNDPSQPTASWARDWSRLDISYWECLVFKFMRLKCLQEREWWLCSLINSSRWKDPMLLVWQLIYGYIILYPSFLPIPLLLTSPKRLKACTAASSL